MPWSRALPKSWPRRQKPLWPRFPPAHFAHISHAFCFTDPAEHPSFPTARFAKVFLFSARMDGLFWVQLLHLGFLLLVAFSRDFFPADFCLLFCSEAPGEGASQEGCRHLVSIIALSAMSGLGGRRGTEQTCHYLCSFCTFFSVSLFFPFPALLPSMKNQQIKSYINPTLTSPT